MHLIENWDAILKKAWSIKFSALSAVLGGLEVAVQMVQPAGVPQGAFAGFAAMVSVAAAVARVMQQKELTGGEHANVQQQT